MKMFTKTPQKVKKPPQAKRNPTSGELSQITY
jgi:hypothetical protein